VINSLNKYLHQTFLKASPILDIMRIKLVSYMRNPNVGLYGLATDRFCLLPKAANKQARAVAEEILGVPVYCSNIAGTSLVGALTIGQGNQIVVPEIIFDTELQYLKQQGLNVIVMPTTQTALGNNIVLANGRLIAGLNYTDDEVQFLCKALKAKTIKMSLLMLSTIGSLLYATQKGGLVHPEISDKELLAVSKFLGVKIVPTTVNQGNPFVGVGVLANTHGVLAGELSRGLELSNIQEGLGVIDG
jgi:translation initiation factor 6